MSNPKPFKWPKNSDYGSGVFRRRIRLQTFSRHTDVELEDCNHGFRLRLHHDGIRVTNIVTETLRYPFNTCAQAVEPLKRVVGCRIDMDEALLRRTMVPEDNCTHLYDMAALALAHSVSPHEKRQYDLAVSDEIDGETMASVRCNGEEIHCWRISSHTLVAPEPLCNLPIMRGFYGWAAKRFSGDTLEAAVILQRGYFVAQSRRFDYRNAAGGSAKIDNMPDRSCYSYNSGVVEKAFRVGRTMRDFTHNQELLLKFE